MSPLDPLYLLIIATGLLVTPSAGVSIAWLIVVAIAWPALHRARRAAEK
jgi:hypothetical protein